MKVTILNPNSLSTQKKNRRKENVTKRAAFPYGASRQLIKQDIKEQVTVTQSNSLIALKFNIQKHYLFNISLTFKRPVDKVMTK